MFKIKTKISFLMTILSFVIWFFSYSNITYAIYWESQFLWWDNIWLSAWFTWDWDFISNKTKLRSPSAVISYSGKLYISDTGNHCIRQVNSSWIVSTLAWLCWSANASYLEWNWTWSRFSSPNWLAISANWLFLYVADSGNARIRKIDLTTWDTSLVAWWVASYIEWTGSLAWFNYPYWLALYNNDLYVADWGFHNVRKIDVTTNVTSLVAWSTIWTSWYWYIEWSGSVAKFNAPKVIDIDSTWTNLYVGELYRVRKIVIATKTTSLVAWSTTTLWDFGNIDSTTNTSVRFNDINWIAFDKYNTRLYISDKNNYRLRLVNPTTGATSTYAWTWTTGSYLESYNTWSIRINNSSQIYFDNADKFLYLADTGNNVIRRFDANVNTALDFKRVEQLNIYGSGNLTASNIMNPWVTSDYDDMYLYFQFYDNDSNRNNYIDIEMKPTDVVFDWTDLFSYTTNTTTTNTYERRIYYWQGKLKHWINYHWRYRIRTTDNAIVWPWQEYWLNSQYYDNDIKILDLWWTNKDYWSNTVKTFSSSQFRDIVYWSWVMFASSGNCITKFDYPITLENYYSGSWVTIYWDCTTANLTDWTYTWARLNSPNWLALDSTGNILYVADTGNNKIRKITLNDWNVTILAWWTVTSTWSYPVNIWETSDGINARFNNPSKIELSTDGSTLYVTDKDNKKIKKIATSNWFTTTIANTNNYPLWIAYDNDAWVIYYADSWNWLDWISHSWGTADWIKSVKVNDPYTSKMEYYKQSYNALAADPYDITYDPNYKQLYITYWFGTAWAETRQAVVQYDITTKQAKEIAGYISTDGASATTWYTERVGTITRLKSAQTITYDNANGKVITYDWTDRVFREIPITKTLLDNPTKVTVKDFDNTVINNWTPEVKWSFISVELSFNRQIDQFNIVDVELATTWATFTDTPSISKYFANWIATFTGTIQIPTLPIYGNNSYHIQYRFRNIYSWEVSTWKPIGTNLETDADIKYWASINTSNSWSVLNNITNLKEVLYSSGKYYFISGNDIYAINSDNMDPNLVYNIADYKISPTWSNLLNPEWLAIDESRNLLYISDTSNNQIKRIDLTLGQIDTIAWSTSSWTVDWTWITARFRNPGKIEISADGSMLYVADTTNRKIREIDLYNSYSVTTLATVSSGLKWITLDKINNQLYYIWYNNSYDYIQYMDVNKSNTLSYGVIKDYSIITKPIYTTRNWMYYSTPGNFYWYYWGTLEYRISRYWYSYGTYYSAIQNIKYNSWWLFVSYKLTTPSWIQENIKMYDVNNPKKVYLIAWGEIIWNSVLPTCWYSVGTYSTWTFISSAWYQEGIWSNIKVNNVLGFAFNSSNWSLVLADSNNGMIRSINLADTNNSANTTITNIRWSTVINWATPINPFFKLNFNIPSVISNFYTQVETEVKEIGTPFTGTGTDIQYLTPVFATWYSMVSGIWQPYITYSKTYHIQYRFRNPYNQSVSDWIKYWWNDEDTPDITTVSSPDNGSNMILTNRQARDILYNSWYYYYTAGNWVYRVTDDWFNTELLTSSWLFNPDWLTINDSGSILYIADTDNNQIKKLDLTTKSITLIAWSQYGWDLDGYMPNIKLNKPGKIALYNSGTLYISDYENRKIKKLNLNNWQIETVINLGPFRQYCPTWLSFDKIRGKLYYGNSYCKNNIQNNTFSVNVYDIETWITNQVYASRSSARVRTSSSNTDPVYLSPSSIYYDNISNKLIVSNIWKNWSLNRSYGGNVTIYDLTTKKETIIAGNIIVNESAYTNWDIDNRWYTEIIWQKMNISTPTAITLNTTNGNVMFADNDNWFLRQINLVDSRVLSWDTPSFTDINNVDIPNGTTSVINPYINFIYSGSTRNNYLTRLETEFELVGSGFDWSGIYSQYLNNANVWSTAFNWSVWSDYLGYGKNYHLRYRFYNPYSSSWSEWQYYKWDSSSTSDLSITSSTWTANMVLSNIEARDITYSSWYYYYTTKDSIYKIAEGGNIPSLVSNVWFSSPDWLAIDDINRWLYIADTGNHRIKRLNLDNTSQIDTIAWTIEWYAEWTSTWAKFDTPRKIALGGSSNEYLYIMDEGNARIRQIDLYNQFTVSTLKNSSNSPINFTISWIWITVDKINNIIYYGSNYRINKYNITTKIDTVMYYNNKRCWSRDRLWYIRDIEYDDISKNIIILHNALYDNSSSRQSPNILLYNTLNGKINAVAWYDYFTTPIWSVDIRWYTNWVGSSIRMNNPVAIAFNRDKWKMLFSDYWNKAVRTLDLADESLTSNTEYLKNYLWTPITTLSWSTALSPQVTLWFNGIAKSNYLVLVDVEAKEADKSFDWTWVVTQLFTNPGTTDFKTLINSSHLKYDQSYNIRYRLRDPYSWDTTDWVSYGGNNTDSDLVVNNADWVRTSKFYDPTVVLTGSTLGWAIKDVLYSSGKYYFTYSNNIYVTNAYKQDIERTVNHSQWLTATWFNNPNWLAIDESNNYLYVADSSNYQIKRINLNDNSIITIAWSTAWSNDGTWTLAKFNYPFKIEITSDGNTLYVWDWNNKKIRKIELNNNNKVTTIVNTYYYPYGLALDEKNNILYFADSWPTNDTSSRHTWNTLNEWWIKTLDLSTGLVNNKYQKSVLHSYYNSFAYTYYSVWSDPFDLFYDKNTNNLYVSYWWAPWAQSTSNNVQNFITVYNTDNWTKDIIWLVNQNSSYWYYGTWTWINAFNIWYQEWSWIWAKINNVTSLTVDPIKNTLIFADQGNNMIREAKLYDEVNVQTPIIAAAQIYDLDGTTLINSGNLTAQSNGFILRTAVQDNSSLDSVYLEIEKRGLDDAFVDNTPINWTTSVASYSGIVAAWSNTIINHVFWEADIQPITAYHIRVRPVDSKGNKWPRYYLGSWNKDIWQGFDESESDVSIWTLNQNMQFSYMFWVGDLTRVSSWFLSYNNNYDNLNIKKLFVNGNDLYYINSNNFLYRIKQTTGKIDYISYLPNMVAMSFDKDNQFLYWTDWQTINRFNFVGNIGTPLTINNIPWYTESGSTAAQFNGINWLAISKDWLSLYIADTNNNRVRKLNLDIWANYLTTSLIAGAWSVGWASVDLVWISGASTSNIYRPLELLVSSDNSYLYVFSNNLKYYRINIPGNKMELVDDNIGNVTNIGFRQNDDSYIYGIKSWEVYKIITNPRWKWADLITNIKILWTSSPYKEWLTGKVVSYTDLFFVKDSERLFFVDEYKRIRKLPYKYVGLWLEPADVIFGVSQLESDGTGIWTWWSTKSQTFYVKTGNFTYSFPVKLKTQIEFKPIWTNFDNSTNIVESDWYYYTGSMSTTSLISKWDFAPNNYHYQIRVTDTYGNVSKWYDAYSNASWDTDITISNIWTSQTNRMVNSYDWSKINLPLNMDNFNNMLIKKGEWDKILGVYYTTGNYIKYFDYEKYLSNPRNAELWFVTNFFQDTSVWSIKWPLKFSINKDYIYYHTDRQIYSLKIENMEFKQIIWSSTVWDLDWTWASVARFTNISDIVPIKMWSNDKCMLIVDKLNWISGKIKITNADWSNNAYWCRWTNWWLDDWDVELWMTWASLWSTSCIYQNSNASRLYVNGGKISFTTNPTSTPPVYTAVTNGWMPLPCINWTVDTNELAMYDFTWWLVNKISLQLLWSNTFTSTKVVGVASANNYLEWTKDIAKFSNTWVLLHDTQNSRVLINDNGKMRAIEINEVFAPVITSISQSSGFTWTLVTVSGNYLIEEWTGTTVQLPVEDRSWTNYYVIIGDLKVGASDITEWYNDHITFHIPNWAKTWKIAVKTKAWVSNGFTFTVTNPPVITWTSPANIPLNTYAEIIWNYFGSFTWASKIELTTASWYINITPVANWTDWAIKILIPNNIISWPAKVTTQYWVSEVFFINVLQGNPPNKPELSSPSNGAIDLPVWTTKLVTKSYVEPDWDAHDSTQWTIENSWGTIVRNYTSNSDLVSTNIPPDILVKWQKYRWYVKFKDNKWTWSNPSDGRYFTVVKDTITPGNTTPETPNPVSPKDWITWIPYADIYLQAWTYIDKEDNLAWLVNPEKSKWWLRKVPTASGKVLVAWYPKEQLTWDKKSLLISTLDPATTYCWSVSYTDSNMLESSWSTQTCFATIWLEIPVVPITWSCATAPTYLEIPNIWITTEWYPLVSWQAWTYSVTPGNCTYTCINGYSWSGCTIPPPAGRWTWTTWWGWTYTPVVYDKPVTPSWYTVTNSWTAMNVELVSNPYVDGDIDTYTGSKDRLQAVEWEVLYYSSEDKMWVLGTWIIPPASIGDISFWQAKRYRDLRQNCVDPTGEADVWSTDCLLKYNVTYSMLWQKWTYLVRVRHMDEYSTWSEPSWIQAFYIDKIPWSVNFYWSIRSAANISINIIWNTEWLVYNWTGTTLSWSTLPLEIKKINGTVCEWLPVDSTYSKYAYCLYNPNWTPSIAWYLNWQWTPTLKFEPRKTWNYTFKIIVTSPKWLTKEQELKVEVKK